MAKLTEDERAAIEAQMVTERERLAAQLAGLERTFADLVASADVEPADDEHDPDGTTAYERAQVTSLAVVTRERLAEVDAALASVGDAGYGACSACGGPIGIERLEALLGTSRCVGCAAGGSVRR